MEQSVNGKVTSCAITYTILVTLLVFQLLMSLLKLVPQPLSYIRWFMSVTRDTFGIRREQVVGHFCFS